MSLVSLDLRRGVVTLTVYCARTFCKNSTTLPGFMHGWSRLRKSTAAAGRLCVAPAAVSSVACRPVDELRSCCCGPEWLLAKLSVVGPYALIGDFDLVRGDPNLEVVQAALRLSLSALVADASQLSEQLLGRMQIDDSESPRILQT